MEAGDVFCNDSIRFRSMKDDLLDDRRWEHKEKLIAEAGLGILDQPIEEHLAELKEQLETRIAEVNRRISTGENEHFKIKSNGHQTRWTLEYPGETEAANHFFFDQLPQAHYRFCEKREDRYLGSANKGSAKCGARLLLKNGYGACGPRRLAGARKCTRQLILL